MIKKFIKRLTVFLIILTLLILFLNLCYNKFVLPRTALQRSDNQFYEYKGDTKILFVGDSQVQRGLNPLMINNSFNFASADEDYIENYYKLKATLDIKDFKPEIVILPVGLHSFSSRRAIHFNNEWYWKRYVDFDELSTFSDDVSPTERKLKAIFPVIGNGLDFLSILVEGKSKLVKGHKMTYGDFSTLEDKSEEASRRVVLYLKDYEKPNGVLLIYFQKILDLAKEKKIKVVLIKFPLTEEYYRIADEYLSGKQTDYQTDYYRTIKNITAKYDNVYTLDYQRIFFNNASLFHNSDHLNSVGAEIFSQLINKDLEKI